MLKSVAFRVFAAVLIASVMGAVPVAAGLPGEVAHSAMGGSTLMNTTAQFNAWTHWIVEHDNFVELNVSNGFGGWKTAGSSGQATLHWKFNEENNLLFRVREFDLGGQNTNFLWGGTLNAPFLSPAALIDRLSVSEYNAYLEGQMLNLAWARALDGGGGFSVGVLFADAGYKAEDSEAAHDWIDKSGAFGGQVTWGNGDGLDVAASFFSESSTRGAGEGEVESDFTHFDLTARYALDEDWILQFGGLMGSGSVGIMDVSLMGLTANLGRHLLDTDDAAVTAEFYVGYFNEKKEYAVEGVAHEFNDSSMVIPGTRVAAWTQISRRFQIMAGANALWYIDKEKEEAGTAEEIETWRGMHFTYSGGLAYVPNHTVRIEGQLDMGSLNNLLSLGNTTPLLMRVGATFVF